MTARKRKMLVVVIAGLFVFFTPLAILHCQGYRVDLEKRGLVKTGGLYFNTTPKGALVYINNKSTKKTDPFFGAALIENLKPGKYTSKVQKKGFQAWEKKLEVEEEKVTSAKSIHLVPDQIQTEIISQNIYDFWFAPGGKEILLLEKKSEEKTWALKLFNIDKGLKSHILEQEVLLKKLKGQAEELNLKKVAWSSNKEIFLLRTETGDKSFFFIVNASKTPAFISWINLPKGAEEVIFHPSDPEILIFREKVGKDTYALFRHNTGDLKSELLVKAMTAFTLKGDKIVWIDPEGHPKESTLQGDSAVLSSNPLPLNNGEIKVHTIGSYLLVQQGKEFWLLNQQGIFEKMQIEALSLNPSPAGKKISFWNGHEIELWYLKDQDIQPFRKKGEWVFLTRLSNQIENALWWKEDYLLVIKELDSGQKEIEIIECDDRDRVQSWSLGQFDARQVQFNPQDRKLYLLIRENLISSQEL